MAITITTLAVIYIFYDALDAGDFLGNFLGLVCATGLAVGAVIIRSSKKISLVPSAMVGKLMVALIALFFADNLTLENKDIIIVSEGVSCRQQIQQGTNRETKHLVELLSEYI